MHYMTLHLHLLICTVGLIELPARWFGRRPREVAVVTYPEWKFNRQVGIAAIVVLFVVLAILVYRQQPANQPTTAWEE